MSNQPLRASVTHIVELVACLPLAKQLTLDPPALDIIPHAPPEHLDLLSLSSPSNPEQRLDHNAHARISTSRAQPRLVKHRQERSQQPDERLRVDERRGEGRERCEEEDEVAHAAPPALVEEHLERLAQILEDVSSHIDRCRLALDHLDILLRVLLVVLGRGRDGLLNEEGRGRLVRPLREPGRQGSLRRRSVSLPLWLGVARHAEEHDQGGVVRQLVRQLGHGDPYRLEHERRVARVLARDQVRQTRKVLPRRVVRRRAELPHAVLEALDRARERDSPARVVRCVRRRGRLGVPTAGEVLPPALRGGLALEVIVCSIARGSGQQGAHA